MGTGSSTVRPRGLRSVEGSLTPGLLKDRAYSDIKERLLSGEFPPGSFLSERMLADMLAMSKTPIKAALEKLEAEGFIAVSPQQGIVVRDLSIEEIADQFEIRLALETFVARSIAGRLTAEQIEWLEENLAAQKQNARDGDIRRGVELDTAFHMLLCEFLGNREILRVMSQLREKIHRVILRINDQNTARLAASHLEHRTIADAILQGDAALAARRVEEHLEYGKQYLLSPRRR